MLPQNASSYTLSVHRTAYSEHACFSSILRASSPMLDQFETLFRIGPVIRKNLTFKKKIFFRNQNTKDKGKLYCLYSTKKRVNMFTAEIHKLVTLLLHYKQNLSREVPWNEFHLHGSCTVERCIGFFRL